MLPPPADTAFHPSQAPQGEAEFALTLVRAMIAAAKADGHIDDERAPEDRRQAGLVRHRRRGRAVPERRSSKSRVDIDELVAGAKTDAQKLELYTASRLTIDPDTRAERGYLDLLAGRLGLPDALVDHVEATVAAATGGAGRHSRQTPCRPADSPALVGSARSMQLRNAPRW